MICESEALCQNGAGDCTLCLCGYCPSDSGAGTPKSLSADVVVVDGSNTEGT